MLILFSCKGQNKNSAPPLASPKYQYWFYVLTMAINGYLSLYIHGTFQCQENLSHLRELSYRVFKELSKWIHCPPHSSLSGYGLVLTHPHCKEMLVTIFFSLNPCLVPSTSSLTTPNQGGRSHLSPLWISPYQGPLSRAGTLVLRTFQGDW